MALLVPVVTIDHLRAFHAKHFPNIPLPEQYLCGYQAEAREEISEDLDDGLGYYSDGMKRTLTDEQIAMFRHSEMRAILRGRKQKQEGGEISGEDQPPRSVLLEPSSSGPIGLSSAASDCSSSKQLMNAVNSKSPEKVSKLEIDKPTAHRWATSSERTKARNKKHRNNYRAKKKAMRLQKKSFHDRDDESDEWDPWHQANGPDVQKDAALDLNY